VTEPNALFRAAPFITMTRRRKLHQVRQPPIIILLMRKKSSGHSIERLFESLTPFISRRFEVRTVQVPCDSRGILRCVRNLIFTARLRGDVIHVTGDIHYCTLAIRRRQCVLTVHDLCSLTRLKGVRKFVFSVLWFSIPVLWAPRLTAISEETKKQLEHEFPATAGKIELIPNCVDAAFVRNSPFRRSDSGRPRVLQVGTGPNKNLERVAVATSGLPVHLRIIGPISYQQGALLRSLDLDWSSAEQLSAEDLMLEYRHSDVLVFASIYEGFGLPIVEAQAMGIPVITSKMAPMSDTAGDAALFVDPYDEGDIREALERLLCSPDLACRLSDRGRSNAERFDVRTVAGQYADLYTRTLSRLQ
jgi:glycosyltransferase involved in cell wall biosynthesis